MRAFVCESVTPSGAHLPNALSDQTRPPHYCSCCNYWPILILPLLTSSCLIAHGWRVIRKEEKMDEAVKQGKEMCRIAILCRCHY